MSMMPLIAISLVDDLLQPRSYSQHNFLSPLQWNMAVGIHMYIVDAPSLRTSILIVVVSVSETYDVRRGHYTSCHMYTLPPFIHGPERVNQLVFSIFQQSYIRYRKHDSSYCSGL